MVELIQKDCDDAKYCILCEKKKTGYGSYEKRIIFGFVLISISILCVVLSIAIYNTQYPGLPTISLLLAEQLWFTITTVLYLYTWAILLSLILFKYTCRPYHNNKRIASRITRTDEAQYFCCKTINLIEIARYLGYFFYFLMFLVILFIGLIPVITVTENPSPHYMVTTFLGGFFLIAETLLLIDRWIIWKIIPSPTTKWNKYVLILNTTSLLFAYVCGAVFGLMTMFTFEAELFTPLAICEFCFFLFVFYMRIYHVLETHC